MKNAKLLLVLDIIGGVLNYSNDFKITLRDRYLDMPEEEIIEELALTVYYRLHDDLPNLMSVLNTICNLGNRSNYDLEKMVEEMKKAYNLDNSTMPLETNHTYILDELRNICYLFNENNIDYYLVGSLPCYIKLNIPIFRYYDEINILVNEKDLDKVKKVVNSLNYQYKDLRNITLDELKNNNYKPVSHLVSATNQKINIGFLLFERTNNIVVAKVYSYQVYNNRLIVNVKKKVINEESYLARYEDTPLPFRDTSFKMNTIEGAYITKSYINNEKDLLDKRILKNFIKDEKLSIIHNNGVKYIEEKNVNI